MYRILETEGSALGAPKDIKRVGDVLWELPASRAKGMRVPVRIYADEKLLASMDDGVFEQAANVATLPGIVGASSCMPDGHLGYGFPIGGMAAFDVEHGIISPGGIGFDINCGMRLVRTGLTLEEAMPRLRELVEGLFARIPTGVGSGGALSLTAEQMREITEKGARWCIEHGYGWEEDLALTENRGCAPDADSGAVSAEAVERGRGQIGSLGSGNHYLEIQVARPDGIADPLAAKAFGIDLPDQVVVMFHCGSRGFGHQVATDYLRSFTGSMESAHRIRVPDRGLACAPFDSPEGRRYFAAMSAAINVAYANRQMILHRIREVFSDVFHRDPNDLGMRMIYDVSHNTAQLEEHEVEGRRATLLVHRKGATRSLGPGSADLPDAYKKVGQPVIVGGSMETGSWLLAGTEGAASVFNTTAHGSGRAMSRSQAKKQFNVAKLRADLEQRGILIRAASISGLAEEAGAAYKDIDEVVSVVERAGISRKVARLVPVACIKG
ncbi:MAG: RtcB family protein [Spirochaetes bacterium]|nr:RtcB family protein [Spirochaetota bacterium]